MQQFRFGIEKVSNAYKYRMRIILKRKGLIETMSIARALTTITTRTCSQPTFKRNFQLILSSKLSVLSPVVEEKVVFSTLVEMQSKVCKKYPSRPALGTFKDGKFEWTTYEQLGKDVDSLRSVLSSKFGIEYGDKVAIISNNRVEWAVSFFAVNSLGAQFVPMYEAQSEQDWEFIIQDSGSKLVIVANTKIQERLLGFLNKTGELPPIDIIVLDSQSDHPNNYRSLLTAAAASPAPVPSPPLTPEDLSVIIYTSGTTGKPKGVELQHRNVSAVIINSRPLFADLLEGPQTSLAFLPWAHVYGLSCELLALLSQGHAMAVVPDREHIMNCLTAAQPTLIISVPVLYNKIYDGVMKTISQGSDALKMVFNVALAVSRERNERLRSGKAVGLLLSLEFWLMDRFVFKKLRDRISKNIRVLGCGGAAVPEPVQEFFAAIGLPILEGYGLTETAPIIAMNGLRPADYCPGTAGRPLTGADIRIVDPATLEEVPQGSDGEITVSGPMVMKGYHRNPTATSEVFFERDGRRYFRTGDLGRFVTGGFLKITGRIKEQFKLENGKYVAPVPVEDALGRSPLVLQVFVSGSNRPFTTALLVPNLQELAALVSSRKGAAPAKGKDQSQGKEAEEDGRLSELLQAAAQDQTAFDQLFQRQDVQALFNEQLVAASASLKHYYKPAVWQALREPFSQENQLVTPKMSLRRNNIVKRYQGLLDQLYSGEAGVRVTYPRDQDKDQSHSSPSS